MSVVLLKNFPKKILYNSKHSTSNILCEISGKKSPNIGFYISITFWTGAELTDIYLRPVIWEAILILDPIDAFLQDQKYLVINVPGV